MEQNIVDLRKIIIRQLTDPADKHRWNILVKEQHYLKSASMMGMQIRYIAECDGEWVACLGCSVAVQKSSLRTSWLKWTKIQEKQRIHLVVQNSRFLILEGISTPNLASRCLSLLGKRISADWENTYGHPVYLLETFVDENRSGSCYKACGWQELGLTKGFRREVDGYKRHGIKKRYFVYPIKKKAQSLLGGEKTIDDKVLEPLQMKELPLVDKVGMPSIHSILKKYFPRPKNGKVNTSGYHLDVSVALVLSGFICGVKDSENIAGWAKELDDKFKRVLGCPYKIRKGIYGYQTPSANTIRYALQDIDSTILEQAMTEWASLCGINTDNTQLALDGKVLRGAKTDDERAPNHVTLYDVKSGTVVDQELVPNKTSEVTIARDIFDRNDLTGSLVTADAAHTNKKTASKILKKKAIFCSPSKTISLHFSTH